MTTTAADIDAAYATLRIATQYMTMPELDAHVAQVLAIAAAVPVIVPLNLAAEVAATPVPSVAQVALMTAEQALALAPLTSPSLVASDPAALPAAGP